jgi:CHASE2 domain-containing sensor protein
VKLKAVREKILKTAPGVALTVLCGLILWQSPLGDAWVNASYDYLFYFGSPAVSNNVVLILMDNAAFDQFHQSRGQPWDRALHAKLLNRLADDGCDLVAFDSFFRELRDLATDNALADAMRRQHRVVLMAEQARVTHPNVTGVQPTLPAELFLDAAKTNWGVAYFDPDSTSDSIVRRHWPFPSPINYPSLPWTIARLTGAKLDPNPQERWLRYYGNDGAWTRISYRFALTQPTNYFRNKIVFIGTEPKVSLPGVESDKFSTPYTRWTGEASGGVEILVTEFLNLANRDWLRRPDGWMEFLFLFAAGTLLVAGFGTMRLITACIAAIMIAATISLVAILWSYFSNYWFPWLIIAGAQVPCALAWTVAVKMRHAWKTATIVRATGARPGADQPLPDAPGYELIHPPFGEGAYGKVWLAKNQAGQWRALKAVYLANFEENTDPYEREFKGISRYQPFSGKHPGLLRVDFVSKKKSGYFYYVMELGDPLKPGWEKEPSTYVPRDLVSEPARSPARRLPLPECVRIGLALTDALDFLHRQGLTHRDIKPQNIIFVNGQPKLADLGLIAEIRPLDQVKTYVGTPGYMPPPPEPPGTPQADIYAMGMVLYVLATGRNAAFFPEIATTLVDAPEPANFFPLNNIILKACRPNPLERYATAAEMHAALLRLEK